MKIRQTTKQDLPWVKKVFQDQWSGDFIISVGKKHYPKDLLGIIAEEKGKRLGLLTYEVINKQIEITSLNSFEENRGVATTLIKHLIKVAKKRGIKRVFVITDNSNLRALGFYQKRGFVIKAVYSNSFEELRKIKPQIPKISENGIPLRDEIELEYFFKKRL